MESDVLVAPDGGLNAMRPPVIRSKHGKQLTIAGNLAVAKMGLGSDVRCEIIAGSARDAFGETWDGHSGRIVSWNWARMALEFQSRHPKCFNVAVWHDETLCGLAIGTVNTERFVGLDFLEGNPDPAHPLKGRIIPIVLTMMEAYRTIIDVEELRLYHVDPILVPMYQSMGFVLAPELGDPHHMVRR